MLQDHLFLYYLVIDCVGSLYAPGSLIIIQFGNRLSR